jgi:hypothetical protein
MSGTGIRAVSEHRGTFSQSTLSLLLIKITDFDGNPCDPSLITLDAVHDDTSEVLIEDGIPTKQAVGFYIYEISLASDATIGDYTVTWSYTIDGTLNTELQTITIADKDTDKSNYTMYFGAASVIRNTLETYIRCTQRIPVYWEQAMPTSNRSTYYFTFNKWNQAAGKTRIFRNDVIVEEGMEIDYFKGKVTFDNPLSSYDKVFAQYNFSWFSEDDLNEFLKTSIQAFNSFPPHGSASFASLEDKYIPAVLYGAAADAIREMLMCLNFQEPRLIFEDADKAFQNLETLKKNYEEKWKLLVEQKKLGPYVGLHKAVVVPEFTLPGGRSRWFRHIFKSGIG